MSNYIDGFVFPIAKAHLKPYRQAATAIADIWKEHGALAYFEYVGDDLHPEGTSVFPQVLDMKPDDTVVFGWVIFASRAERDTIHKKVSEDPRMADLVAPIMDPVNLVFDAKRMVYGGFEMLVGKE